MPPARHFETPFVDGIAILVDQDQLAGRRDRHDDDRLRPLEVGVAGLLAIRQLHLVISEREVVIAERVITRAPLPSRLRADWFFPLLILAHALGSQQPGAADCLDLGPFLHTLPLRMPRNDQLHKILLIGSGPIVIGQGCEFDYSGVQACKALREEGYEVVLVNSNPATIMTDPEFADRTYIEPITPEVVEKIIEREKPDALLPTLGGQTALNAAMELNRNGVLERHDVKLIGANAEAIERARTASSSRRR